MPLRRRRQHCVDDLHLAAAGACPGLDPTSTVGHLGIERDDSLLEAWNDLN